MAKAIGISHSILGRIERGSICDSDSLTKILAWLLDGETAKRRSTSRTAKRELSNAASIASLEMNQ
jgi:ribosome-binding protein aMBF1 (putative translation factor)